ncbi:MAG: apolipoprotein N-acyltransferase [Cyanobium sp.]
MGNDRRLWGLAIGAAGLLAGLALAPVGLPLLLWPALALLWALAGSPPPGLGRGRGPLLAAGLWGLAAVLVSHRWLLWLHPLDWIGVPPPLSLPICLAIWLACGLLGAALVSLWLGLMRRLDASRPSTALIGSLLWGLAEVQLARGPLFWFGLGSSALPGDRLLAGVAALAGAGAVAALQLLIAWCLWRALAPLPGRRRWLLAGLALVAASHLAGAGALAAIAPQAGASERLLVLQPAIPTRHKFEPRQQLALLRFLAEAQRRTAPQASGTDSLPGPTADSPAALDPAGQGRRERGGTVLPQADRDVPMRGSISLVLPEGSLALGQPLPLPAGVEVLSGGFRQQGLGQRSSLLRFDRGELLASGWVDKHRLVPLGEWVPLADLWRWSGLSAVGGLEPGAPSRLLARPTGSVAVAICYELSDGAGLAAASRQGAGWLLASANLDPYPLLLQQQFKALAQLRAIESGRWLVSAANTGPSVLVDARGSLRDQLAPGLRRSGLMELHRLSALTPYVRWGERPLLVLVLFAVGLRMCERRLSR